MFYNNKKITIKRILKFLEKKIIGDIFKRYFNLWQKLGFHITKNDSDGPIPNTRELRLDIFSKMSNLIGINMNEKEQFEILNKFKNKFKKEFDSIPLNQKNEDEYYINNCSFGSVDGDVLYGMIRLLKPKNIYEIGSGNSTLLMVQAVKKNKQEINLDCNIVSIDPYPNDRTKNFAVMGNIELLTQKVEEIKLSKFNNLKENDILFIDSSHVLKIGSDVQYEYLDLLPRLNKGVFVHIHDIFLPSEYPKEWVLKEHRFWNEQYLLQAFLSFNDSFKVIIANSYLHLKHSKKLEEVFNSYNLSRNWPGSFWIKKIK